MSKTKSALEGLDITHDELSRLTAALKNDEFKQLFADYYNEINDPANQRLYEQELTQLEAERGVDITFVHPQPGYVLKTIADGRVKTFINVAQSDRIAKPTSKRGVNGTGEQGLQWSLPYTQSAAKRDYDKSGEPCSVYDVVFHPDTIHLALKNEAFKQMVASTALDAVANANSVVLDVVNVKYPKIAFKGVSRPTVIRKQSKSFRPSSDEPSPLDGIYPPIPTAEQIQAERRPTSRVDNGTPPTRRYTTPKHTITQRKHVDYAELTNELDAKLNVALPSELVVSVELPLLRNIKDTTLDVTANELYLVSEVPAKYQLKLQLPYAVDESRGSAKFDAVKRTLVVQLPVKRRQLTIDDITNGNATPIVMVAPSPEAAIKGQQATLIEELPTKPIVAAPCTAEPIASLVSPFLNPSIHYDLPTFTAVLSDRTIALTLDVKNVVESSLEFIHEAHCVRIKFQSIGSGCFPLYYAFCLLLPETIAISECQPDVWDNNVIVQLELAVGVVPPLDYAAGLDADDLKAYTIVAAVPTNAVISDGIESILLDKLSLNDADKKTVAVEPVIKKQSKPKDKLRSYSESNCDDFATATTVTTRTAAKASSRDIDVPTPRTPIKQRAYSECSNQSSVDESGQPKHLKGILKRRSSSVWSISESSLDENAVSRSVDCGGGSSGGEEHLSEHAKKSVRFDNNIRKFCFRTNSTIVGQRKPKTNKRKKKKRTSDRRYSEGEASDYDPKHSSSEGESTAINNAGHKSSSDKDGKCTMHDSGVDLSERSRRHEENDEDDDDDEDDDEVYHDAVQNDHNKGGGVQLEFKSDMIFDLDM